MAQVLDTHKNPAESAASTHPPASLVCVLLSRCAAFFCLYAVGIDIVTALILLLFYGDGNGSRDAFFSFFP